MATINVGLIAEDKSDIDTITALLKKLTPKSVKVHGINARGCGAIHKKCIGWAKNLSERGCTRLILVHDLDDKRLNSLVTSLSSAMKESPITKNAIVIPIRELEAWLLADHDAIKAALKINKKVPKVLSPETINRPKEYLRDFVRKWSEKRIEYVNTVHNAKIAAYCLPTNLKRCASFVPLVDFAKNHLR